MNVLFATMEMSPLAKVGGLGDVAGSLPRALRATGADVRVAMPMHGAIERASLPLRRVLQGVEVAWPDGPQHVDVWQTDARGVPVYLLENERYFGRPTVYGFDDDLERFIFFCDALLACAPHLGFRPDVVHAQDWHTAFLMTRLATSPAHPWADAGRVYTIHNLALQGNFDEGFAHRHGLASADLAPPDGLPWSTGLSGMAQGIMHADRVNTVSDTYAREILTPEYGAGLDPLLRARAAVVSGIVNGIDYDEFNPRTDPAIACHFSADDPAGRADDRRALQEEAGLPASETAVVFAAVTRLFAQKGMDLAASAFERLLDGQDAQLIILGTGDEELHRTLLRLQDAHPDRVKIWLDFNPPLGQRIYAGCDAFLMPSRYEPCGLGQLIALRYGAVPLARRTGGLADTVQDADLAAAAGNGFVFDQPTAADLQAAAERALAAFRDRAGWRALQDRGMRQDWSWGRAAGKYLELYRAAHAVRLQERGVAGA
ncbi:MAG TPA: glycogen/starch synthase [Dehalococcoidia bacterium]|nr:glycogen/starch synthase [Dehalococcoidia bacterium]